MSEQTPQSMVQEEETFACAKCGKEKKKSEGHFIWGDTTFCCEQCCGDPAKDEHQQEADGVCEFC